MRKTFYQEVNANRRKTVLLFFIFFILVSAVGSAIGIIWFNDYLPGLILATIVGTIYALVMYNTGASTILSSAKAKPVTKQEDPYLFNLVEGLSIAAGLKNPPKIYMIQEESMNAFATGINPEKSYICVTSGLRKRMNRAELEGVIAHEMSHIKNFDIRVMLLAAVLVGVVVMLSDVMLRSFIWGGGSRSNNNDNNGGVQVILMIIAIVLVLLSPIFAQLIKLTISRKREFLADATAVELTRDPSGLSSALKKIRDDHDVKVDTANKSTAHLYIENPLRHTKKKQMFAGLFNTHPPIDERIKILESM
jgi:heat shock protein HtpX